MTESWLPVVGYEKSYQVSDLGRVLSVSRIKISARGSFVTKDKMLRPALKPHHAQVVLFRDGNRKGMLVHRLVLEAFVGPCPAGMEGCHNNGDPHDNRLGNLRWDTTSANAFDRVAHGRDVNARKTHCAHGHPFDFLNTRICKGKRVCRACHRASQRRYLATKRGVAA